MITRIQIVLEDGGRKTKGGVDYEVVEFLDDKPRESSSIRHSMGLWGLYIAQSCAGWMSGNWH